MHAKQQFLYEYGQRQQDSFLQFHKTVVGDKLSEKVCQVFTDILLLIFCLSAYPVAAFSVFHSASPSASCSYCSLIYNNVSHLFSDFVK